MARQALPLAMEHSILALLDEEPMHGYEIHQKLSQMAGIDKIWNLKQSLLYSKLERLESSGFIEQTPSTETSSLPARVVFKLTPTGKQSLLDWIASPVQKARDIRMNFLGKLIIARRYGIDQALDLIKKQREICQRWYDHLLKELPENNQENLDELFVHSYRLYRDRATLHWLDHLEEQLKKASEVS